MLRHINNWDMKIAEIHRRWVSQIIFSLTVPVFFLAFVLLFNPYGMHEMYGGKFTLNILMLFCITLVSLACTRLAFYFVAKPEKVNMSWLWYVVWCLAEVMVISQFHTLYTSLMLHMNYLTTLDDCLKFNYTILAFPYVILSLAFEVNQLKSGPAASSENEDSLLRFHDENLKLKFVIASSAVLYLKSEENYVHVHYVESGKLKSYVLRNSMKSLEEMLTAHGLVRCHRSYVINPTHVKGLKKETEGASFAILDADKAPEIPVSKLYYASLAANL